MKTEINLEEILQKFETYVTMKQPHNHTPIFLKENVLIAMREACEKTVELCAENAELIYFDNAEINKDSILNTKTQIV